MARVFIAPSLLSKRPEFIGAAPWTGPLSSAPGWITRLLARQSLVDARGAVP